jgi:hypothetical protein
MLLRIQFAGVKYNLRISLLVYFVYTHQSLNLKILFMYFDHASTCYLSIISITYSLILHYMTLTALERLGRITMPLYIIRNLGAFTTELLFFYDKMMAARNLF